jgi:phosphoglycolate phosphatase-like HAD superfamily hydrolase
LPQEIAVVITDLDNTLFDWVEVWYRSFSALIDELIVVTGLPRERLLDDARAVHQRHGTSEYYFLIAELPSLCALYPNEDLMHKFRSAVQAYRRARDSAIRLYPTVHETLEYFKANSVLTIGYTESTAFYTAWRVRKLGLDGLLHYLHSPADHDLPQGLRLEDVREHSPQHYVFRHTVHHHTPPGEQKPNPKLLLDIIRDVGAQPHECIYIGDSLMKDITMAQDAGIIDVYAAYGMAQHREAYDLLKRVTHWTDADVAREKALYQRGEVLPTYTLRHVFRELRELFAFRPFSG